MARKNFIEKNSYEKDFTLKEGGGRSRNITTRTLTISKKTTDQWCRMGTMVNTVKIINLGPRGRYGVLVLPSKSPLLALPMTTSEFLSDVNETISDIYWSNLENLEMSATENKRVAEYLESLNFSSIDGPCEEGIDDSQFNIPPLTRDEIAFLKEVSKGKRKKGKKKP
jgi:hypothetical protein